MMRILVTNDDGVAAPGLAVAEAIAADIAGPDGEVWVAAPAFEQSGMSHAITFTSPIKVEQLAAHRFACAGTPADCVILAVCHFMRSSPPDLVISGVNRGHNIAEDAVYSGTVGAAIEAVLQGVPGIALSQYFRQAPPGVDDWDVFSSAKAEGVGIVRALLDQPQTPDLFYNVNFPPVQARDVKGVRVAPQGRRRRGPFQAEERRSPGGRSYFWVRGTEDNFSSASDSDSFLCADGYVTIVPMRPDYTDYKALELLGASVNR